jgi:hypothetical protein
MHYLWYLLVLLAITVFAWRKDLRNDMLWAGIISLPILAVKPLISDYPLNVEFQGSLILFFVERIIILFSFAALASAIYKVTLQKKISPEKHPKRKKLVALICGLIVFSALYTIGFTFIFSILVAMLIDIIIIIVIRKDLIWDMIFSGFSMGILYIILFFISYYRTPGNIENLWFADRISGLTLFSVPIEEVVAVILFGALWGPIYIAFKDLREK